MTFIEGLSLLMRGRKSDKSRTEQARSDRRSDNRDS